MTQETEIESFLEVKFALLHERLVKCDVVSERLPTRSTLARWRYEIENAFSLFPNHSCALVEAAEYVAHHEPLHNSADRLFERIATRFSFQNKDLQGSERLVQRAWGRVLGCSSTTTNVQNTPKKLPQQDAIRKLIERVWEKKTNHSQPNWNSVARDLGASDLLGKLAAEGILSKCMVKLGLTDDEWAQYENILECQLHSLGGASKKSAKILLKRMRNAVEDYGADQKLKVERIACEQVWCATIESETPIILWSSSPTGDYVLWVDQSLRLTCAKAIETGLKEIWVHTFRSLPLDIVVSSDEKIVAIPTQVGLIEMLCLESGESSLSFTGGPLICWPPGSSDSCILRSGFGVEKHTLGQENDIPHNHFLNDVTLFDDWIGVGITNTGHVILGDFSSNRLLYKSEYVYPEHRKPFINSDATSIGLSGKSVAVFARIGTTLVQYASVELNFESAAVWTQANQLRVVSQDGLILDINVGRNQLRAAGLLPHVGMLEWVLIRQGQTAMGLETKTTGAYVLHNISLKKE